MIKISVNGKIKELKENTSLKNMLDTLNYNFDTFAVAINTMFVPIKEYEKTIINDADKIDVLSPVQGG